MSISFGRLYHEESKDNFPFISKDERHWPEEWKKIAYKKYNRFPLITTKEMHVAPSRPVAEILVGRRSRRDFSGAPVSLAALLTILKHAAGISDTENELRTYPSPGARYPIEIYPYVLQSSADLKEGLYHFDVQENGIRRIGGDESIKSQIASQWQQNASCIFFFTGVFDRIETKYQDFAYRFLLQEQGHIAQNMHLVATACELKTCELGKLAGVSDRTIEKFIDIDGTSESLVGVLALGA